MFSRVFFIPGLLAAIWLVPHAFGNDIHCQANFEAVAASLAKKEFVTNRSLSQYNDMFSVNNNAYPVYGQGSTTPFSLNSVLSSFTEDDFYLDVGAGQGRAIHDALSIMPKGTAVGFDLAPATPELQSAISQSNGRLKFVGGKMLEDAHRSGDLKTVLPKPVKLITDYYGASTYGKQMDENIAIEAGLLKKDGYLALTIPTEHYKPNFTDILVGTRINPKSTRAVSATAVQKRVADYLAMRQPFYDEIYKIYLDSESEAAAKNDLQLRKDSDTKYMQEQFAGVLGWLESIQGMKIVNVKELNAETGIMVVLQRTDKPLQVPPLKLEKYNYDAPPTRIYSW